MRRTSVSRAAHQENSDLHCELRGRPLSEPGVSLSGLMANQISDGVGRRFALKSVLIILCSKRPRAVLVRFGVFKPVARQLAQASVS